MSDQETNQSIQATRWYPGMPSPNPGGRPKSVVRVQELARAHTEEAVKTLAAIMANGEAKDSDRIDACIALLDRGYGRPAQEVTGTVVVDDAPDLSDPRVLHDVARRIAFLMTGTSRVQTYVPANVDVLENSSVCS